MTRRKPAEIDDTKSYRVVLNKHIKVGRATLAGNCTLRGDVLRRQLDEDAAAIASYEVVTGASSK